MSCLPKPISIRGGFGMPGRDYQRPGTINRLPGHIQADKCGIRHLMHFLPLLPGVACPQRQMCDRERKDPPMRAVTGTTSSTTPRAALSLCPAQCGHVSGPHPVRSNGLLHVQHSVARQHPPPLQDRLDPAHNFYTIVYRRRIAMLGV